MNQKKVSAETQAEEFSLIPHATLLTLYRNLLKCQVSAARKAKPRASAWPFNAAVVAVAQDLTGEEAILSLEPNPALKVLQGPTRGQSGGAGAGNSAILLQWALGTALTDKTRKTGRVTVVFSNAENAAWLDALEAARAHRLPIIFVHSSDGKKPAVLPNAAKLEPGTELPHIVTDGDDVVAMYRAAHESIGRARRNSGPTLIECVPFRLKGRRRQDSIAAMENYLRSKGLLRRGLKQELLEEIARKAGRVKGR